MDREAALIARAKRDPRAFGQLYDTYVQQVYRFCYQRTGSHHQAQDLTSQTFHRALEGLPQYEWRGVPFGAWLFRIAANLASDQRRHAQRELPLDAVSLQPSAAALDDATEALLHREALQGLWLLVDRLPAQQQRVLILRFGQGLSNQEVSRVVNRSETATKQLVYRAVKALRELARATPATPVTEEEPR